MSNQSLNSWFSGVELGDVKDVLNNIKAGEIKAKQTQEAILKIAGAVVEMTETDGWRELSKKIEKLKEEFTRKPEVYYQNEKIAGLDAGARSALTLLTNWIQLQHKHLENYERRTKQPGE